MRTSCTRSHVIWLQFVVTAAVIFYAGSHLSRYADAIAEKTGLGRTLIGTRPGEFWRATSLRWSFCWRLDR